MRFATAIAALISALVAGAGDEVGTATDLVLGGSAMGMTLGFHGVEGDDDAIELEVKVSANTWLGIGIHSEGKPSMTGGGDGSDVVTCSSAGVQRYFVTGYGMENPQEVPGATCTQEGGVTTLKFMRNLTAARRLSQVAIDPGAHQGLIFARGDEGDFDISYHSKRDGSLIDFAAGELVVPTTTTARSSSGIVEEVGKGVGIPLGDTGMTLAFGGVGDDAIEFEVKMVTDTWISIGINSGGVASMVGNGGGSDVVTCSEAGVQRFSVTAYKLEGGQDVPGATCIQEGGVTTLKFKRDLAAGRRLSQQEIKPGDSQGLIFAHGDAGSSKLGYHAKRGGQNIDFSSGKVEVTPKRSGEALLFLHLALMCIGWGALLPLGAIVSKRYREILQPPGKWMEFHMGLQISGWAMQIVGFLMAILYVEEYSLHFQGPHTIIGLVVVVLGTFQPLNGLLRPHLPKQEDGQPPKAKSTARVAWEWIHKGTGWFAIGLGMLNVLLGLVVLVRKEYDTTTMIVAIVLAVVSLLMPLGALIYSCFQKTRVVVAVF